MRALYSAVNVRRFAFSLTSVAGLPADNDIMFAMVHASLALLGSNTNLRGGDLLTHVGTEGKGALDLGSRTWKYVPFGREEPQGPTALGGLRLLELQPLKQAAMAAIGRLLSQMPGFSDVHEGSAHLHPRRRLVRLTAFERAMALVAIADPELRKRCDHFVQQIAEADENWLGHAERMPAADIETVARAFGDSPTGRQLVESAKAAYAALAARMEALLSV